MVPVRHPGLATSRMQKIKQQNSLQHSRFATSTRQYPYPSYKVNKLLMNPHNNNQQNIKTHTEPTPPPQPQLHTLALNPVDYSMPALSEYNSDSYQQLLNDTLGYVGGTLTEEYPELDDIGVVDVKLETKAETKAKLETEVQVTAPNQQAYGESESYQDYRPQEVIPAQQMQGFYPQQNYYPGPVYPQPGMYYPQAPMQGYSYMYQPPYGYVMHTQFPNMGHTGHHRHPNHHGHPGHHGHLGHMNSHGYQYQGYQGYQGYQKQQGKMQQGYGQVQYPELGGRGKTGHQEGGRRKSGHKEGNWRGAGCRRGMGRGKHRGEGGRQRHKRDSSSQGSSSSSYSRSKSKSNKHQKCRPTYQDRPVDSDKSSAEGEVEQMGRHLSKLTLNSQQQAKYEEIARSIEPFFNKYNSSQRSKIKATDYFYRKNQTSDDIQRLKNSLQQLQSVHPEFFTKLSLVTIVKTVVKKNYQLDDAIKNINKKLFLREKREKTDLLFKQQFPNAKQIPFLQLPDLLKLDSSKLLFLIDGNNIMSKQKKIRFYFDSPYTEEKAEGQVRLVWLFSESGLNAEIFFDNKFKAEQYRQIKRDILTGREQEQVNKVPVFYADKDLDPSNTADMKIIARMKQLSTTGQLKDHEIVLISADRQLAQLCSQVGDIKQSSGLYIFKYCKQMIRNRFYSQPQKKGIIKRIFT